jgi:hypothetical protein
MYRPEKLAPGAYVIARRGRAAAYVTNWNRAQARAARLRRDLAVREARIARAVAA